MKSEKMTSMRRKVIADSKGERDAASAASNQNESLDAINFKLNDVQSANELVAEVVEQKGNQVINAIQNVEAATELTAEATEKNTEQVKELTSVSSKISDKLSKLTSMLEQKVSAVEQRINDTGKSTDTALTVIQDNLPEPVTQNLPELPERILPNPNDNTNEPDADFFPTAPDNPSDVPEKKPKEDPAKNPMQISLDALLKTTKAGFKSTVSITDKISSMLFKYTISALAETAKMAALLFSLVLGIDLLRIHFKYWTDKFTSNFDKFSEDAEEWGGLLQSIFGTLEDIRKFWEAGDWGGLAVAIVKGLTDILYNLGEIIQLGISKITAAVLNALGFEGAALSVKGAALEGFQERTGNSLSEEDQDTLAKYQSKRIEEGPNLYDKANELKTRAADWIRGRDNKNSLTTETDQEQETQKLKAMKPEEREQVLKKGNEARAAIIRFEKYMGDVDPENPTNVQSMDKAYNSIKERLADSDLNDSPATKKELNARFMKVDAQYKKLKTESKPEPAPPTASEDVQRVQNIEKAQDARKTETKTAAPSSTVNAQVNNVNNSKTVHNITPVTATPAPGIFGATSVN
jgi:hypothetical protein